MGEVEDLEQGGSVRPGSDVLGETLAQEVLALGAPLVGLLHAGDPLGRDQEEGLDEGKRGQTGSKSGLSMHGQDSAYPQGRELHVRRLAIGHLHEHDAERPNIDLVVIVRSLNHFLSIDNE